MFRTVDAGVLQRTMDKGERSCLGVPRGPTDDLDAIGFQKPGGALSHVAGDEVGDADL